MMVKDAGLQLFISSLVAGILGRCVPQEWAQFCLVAQGLEKDEGQF